MPIVNTEVPTTAALCSDAIRRIASTYPFVRSDTIAVTANRRPVEALVIGNGGRRTLFAGA